MSRIIQDEEGDQFITTNQAEQNIAKLKQRHVNRCAFCFTIIATILFLSASMFKKQYLNQSPWLNLDCTDDDGYVTSNLKYSDKLNLVVIFKGINDTFQITGSNNLALAEFYEFYIDDRVLTLDQNSCNYTAFYKSILRDISKTSTAEHYNTIIIAGQSDLGLLALNFTQILYSSAIVDTVFQTYSVINKIQPETRFTTISIYSDPGLTRQFAQKDTKLVNILDQILITNDNTTQMSQSLNVSPYIKKVYMEHGNNEELVWSIINQALK